MVDMVEFYVCCIVYIVVMNLIDSRKFERFIYLCIIIVKNGNFEVWNVSIFWSVGGIF